MKLTLGLVLVILGAVLMLGGATLGLAPLVAVYQHAMNDPMGEPAAPEEQTGARMARGLTLGAIGILPFIAGTVILKRQRARDRRQRKNRA
jgi:hypothetical protein